MKKKFTTISIPKETFDKLKEYCEKNGFSISKLVVILIEKQMKNIGNLHD